MNPHRPIDADIDLDALAANTSALRAIVGPAVRLYGVCKGDAYGVGLQRAAPVMLEAGADAIAVADPADVVTLRRDGIDAPILLYPSTTPDMAAEVAEIGAIVTIVDRVSLEAFAATGRKIVAHAKIDCGFGRLGLIEAEWESAFAAIAKTANVHFGGLYTHFAHTEDEHQVSIQKASFLRAIAAAEAAGLRDLEQMAASSRILISHGDLIFNAVNPGRALYGWLEERWMSVFPAKPVVRALTTRVIQVKDLPAGARPGYLDQEVAAPLRIAVLAAGFGDGLPRLAHGLPVLIRGREAPTLGMRSTEHAVVDVTGIEGVSPGDEAVLVGRQRDAEITIERVAEVSGVPLIELLPRIARRAVRHYSPTSTESRMAMSLPDASR